MKDLGQAPWGICNLDISRIFKGSIYYKDLWKIFIAGKYLLKVFGMILQGSSRKLWGSYKNLSKVYVWISSFFFSQLQKLHVIHVLYNDDDLLSYNSSLRSSPIWFQYIHNFIIILSQLYNKPIQWPALSWLVSLIGRALHRHRRGQGFKSHTSLNFFQAFFLQLQKLCI